MTRGKNSTENLLTEIHPTLTTTDNQTFVLGGLGDLTSKRGTYFLTFTAVGVVDAKTKSHPSIGGATSFFVNGKPTGLTAIAVSGTEIDLSWTDNTPKDTGFTITRALDANFTLGVRTFTVKTNVSHFKDTTGLSPTTQYFYKVRANVDDGAPNPSTDAVNTFTLADNENIVDNRSLGATIVGGWTFTSDTQNAIGGDYLAATPKGTKSVTFTPDLSADGTYFVYVRSIKGTGNATNAKVQLFSGGDVKKSFTVNQRTNNGWVLPRVIQAAQGNGDGGSRRQRRRRRHGRRRCSPLPAQQHEHGGLHAVVGGGDAESVQLGECRRQESGRQRFAVSV